MESSTTKYEALLCAAIHKRRSIIFIQTDDYHTEEERLRSILRDTELSKEIDLKNNVNVWSPQLGKRSLWGFVDKQETKLEACLTTMLTGRVPSILIIRGLYYFFGGMDISIDEQAASITTLLTEFFYRNEKEEKVKSRSIIIIESPKFDIPTELKNCIYTLEPPFPDDFDITQELGLDIAESLYKEKPDEKEHAIPGKKYKFKKAFFREKSRNVFENNKKRLLSILKGMKIREIRTMLSYNDYTIEGVDLDSFRECKERMVRDSGLLKVERVPQNYEKFVGDIEGLIRYIEREKVIIDNRIYYNPNMPMPKGVLLVGPPGCGKSETSKAIASKLDMPLYSLDMGRLLGGLMGASEHNFENAIAIAEAAQPCVLRIDEIEKAFAGSGTNDNDQTLTRIVGFFLTWMQERKSMVYIVATANNLDQLRPEFLRKGRWDEIFYLSYPKDDGMIKILHSCLKRYNFYFADQNGQVQIKENNEPIIPQTIIDGIRGFYRENPEVRISGAEIYDIVEQLYKRLFQSSPNKKDIYLPIDLFLKGLTLLSKKDRDVEINQVIDIEILELKKEYALKKRTGKQQERMRKAVRTKYTDSLINRIIKDEMVSLEISAIMSSQNNFTNQKKTQIEALLKNKYNKEAMISEELSNIEVNSSMQNDILDHETEIEIRRLLKLKYKQNDSEEAYKAKGYKSASTWNEDYKSK